MVPEGVLWLPVVVVHGGVEGVVDAEVAKGSFNNRLPFGLQNFNLNLRWVSETNLPNDYNGEIIKMRQSDFDLLEILNAAIVGFFNFQKEKM